MLQPDIYWAGGLSETMKIAAYATVHDLITIRTATRHLPAFTSPATQSPIHTPYQEYLIKWNEVHQFFLASPIRPEGGMIKVPETPEWAWSSTPRRSSTEDGEVVRQGIYGLSIGQFPTGETGR